MTSWPIGCAAEDVIVETDEPIDIDQLGGGIQVRRGDDTVDETVAPHRAFLDGGRRGFLVALAARAEPASIAVGDEVFIRG